MTLAGGSDQIPTPLAACAALAMCRSAARRGPGPGRLPELAHSCSSGRCGCGLAGAVRARRRHGCARPRGRLYCCAGPTRAHQRRSCATEPSEDFSMSSGCWGAGQLCPSTASCWWPPAGWPSCSAASTTTRVNVKRRRQHDRPPTSGARQAGNAELMGWAYEMSAWFALVYGRYEQLIEFGEAADLDAILQQHYQGEHLARDFHERHPHIRRALEPRKITSF